MSVPLCKRRRPATIAIILSTLLFAGGLMRNVRAGDWVWVTVCVLALIANVAWLIWERPKMPVG